MIIVEAEIDYDVYSYEDGWYKITNSGYIDRTKVFSELLKLNLGCIRLDIETDKVDIWCNRIHEIRYIVDGHEIVIDCKNFYGKYFDKDEGNPKELKDRPQPASTIKRAQTNNRGLRIRRPPRVIEEERSWYDENILGKNKR